MAGPRADDLVFVFLLLSVPLPPAAAMTQEVGSLYRISDKHNIGIAGFRSFSWKKWHFSQSCFCCLLNVESFEPTLRPFAGL